MHIRVIGAHLPRLEPNRVDQFVEEDIAQFKTFMVDRIREGKSTWTPDEVEERAIEIASELKADLQTCAMLEAEVTENEQRFHASDFSNPVTTLCGWEPAYLSLDGESVIAEGSWVPPETRAFRVAFYIHEWDHPASLTGPTGALELPPFTPVPERLWRLAPYACLD